MPQRAAFRGTFGSTDFWVVTMPASEVTKELTIPKDVDGWKNLSIEERYQRDVNYRRVRDHIAPYFVKDEDRFVGAFIVAVVNANGMRFRTLAEKGTRFADGFDTHLTESFGILEMTGKEILIPLDGQHRLAGLKFAIKGKDEKEKDIPHLRASSQVGEDICTLILVKHEPEKSRKIFNKVNRYAKPTSKGDNLITADDDYVAVLSREVVIGKFVSPRLVNVRSNTLTKQSGQFTTLATVYEISKTYIETVTHCKAETTRLPSEDDQEVWKDLTESFWKAFVEIRPFRDSLAHPDEEGDQRRAEIREGSVACRPIAQRALAEAICLMVSGTLDGAQGRHPRLEACVDRLNMVDWDPKRDDWQGVLMNGDKVIAGSTAMRLAARIIAYRMGLYMNDQQEHDLTIQFHESTNGRSLPGRVDFNQV